MKKFLVATMFVVFAPMCLADEVDDAKYALEMATGMYQTAKDSTSAAAIKFGNTGAYYNSIRTKLNNNKAAIIAKDGQEYFDWCSKTLDSAQGELDLAGPAYNGAASNRDSAYAHKGAAQSAWDGMNYTGCKASAETSSWYSSASDCYAWESINYSDSADYTVSVVQYAIKDY